MAEESKRYSIVRVDDKCPIVEVGICDDRMCKACEFIKNVYGDTKEQLIKKVAQVLLREELEWYRENLDIIPKGKIDEPLVRILYEHCLDKAKKIVEFLGVK